MTHLQPAPENYEPVPSFILGGLTCGDTWSLPAHDVLRDLVHAFADRIMPDAGENLAIVDADHIIVLGVWVPSDGKGHSNWVGCSAAFEMLAEVHDQIAVAYYEMAARGRLAGLKW